MTDAGNIWASLPLPALMADMNGNIRQANGRAELFLNRSEKALQKQSLTDVCTGPDLSRALEKLRDGHRDLTLNDAVVLGAGKDASCQMHITIDDDDGLLFVMVPHIEDPSRTDGRAAHAAKSAIGMAEMLAHEIKNPLAGIAGAAQLLSMSVNEDDQQLTEMIVSETRRVSKLLEQVEEFGNTLPPQPNAVNLHDVLDRARKSALLGFASDIQIDELFDPSLPEAKADADQLLQVFLNLIKNAAEAVKGQSDKRILLKTYFDGAMRIRRPDGFSVATPLVVEVQDNGPGIPPELQDVIFDPFVSGKENGTGLGLALVSKIVTDHFGWVGVVRSEGGTVFKVALPMFV